MGEGGSDIDAAWRRVLDSILGNEASWVADIGLKAGLFAAIGEAGPAGIREADLARRLGYAERYVGAWCRAAYAF
jgi:hypothetical protein